eukprot:40488-Chlamydomonas_euryale.AAC.1
MEVPSAGEQEGQGSHRGGQCVGVAVAIVPHPPCAADGDEQRAGTVQRTSSGEGLCTGQAAGRDCAEEEQRKGVCRGRAAGRCERAGQQRPHVRGRHRKAASSCLACGGRVFVLGVRRAPLRAWRAEGAPACRTCRGRPCLPGVLRAPLRAWRAEGAPSCRALVQERRRKMCTAPTYVLYEACVSYASYTRPRRHPPCLLPQYVLERNDPRVKFGGMGFEEYWLASFCFNPYGDGYGNRLPHILLGGCVPVTVQEH